MGKSFDPIGLVEQMRDAKRCSSTPRPIVSMSFQLAIPWRVALPQSPPLLHQPGASMNERAAAGQQKPANGQLCLNYLSHPRGQVHIRALAGYSVVVETVFAFPGLGLTAIQAIERQDLILLQAIVFTVAVMVVIINIAMDVVYKFIDPRINLT